MFVRWFAAMALLLPATLPAGETFPLWPQQAPGALGSRDEDIPTLTAFPASDPTGAAVIICPGGGYEHLQMEKEGNRIAHWLNGHGITAFILKYRLGSNGYRHPAMLNDVARAVRTVRAKAADWRVDPNRIAVMGFSAGGHLASTIITHFDDGNPDSDDPVERVSSRPDLGILCYPVITMKVATHGGSKRNLLGENPAEELVELLSNEEQVRENTPPTFIWHTANDDIVPVENALLFAQALAAKRIPFALHVFECGPHGMGLGENPHEAGRSHPWADALLHWLKEHNYAK